MKIVFIHRNEFHKRPPVISVVQYLIELGYRPHVITTGISQQYVEIFKEKNIGLTVLPFNMTTSTVHNIFAGISWGKKARYEISRIAKEEKILLWIEGNYTITSLKTDFINKYPHILQIQELPDTQNLKEKYQHKLLSSIMPTALANFMPEYNRACILSAHFKLKKVPYILPNKPAFLPSRDQLSIIGEGYKDIVNKIAGRKVILYQGSLYKERNLENFIKATSELDAKEYVTVLLGEETKELETYFKINPNIIYVNYIPAPDYLFITSLAYIGLVTYSPYALNTIYCAPNKIFEYSAFGIPMIGNDIPGLKYTIEAAKCGVVCDDKSAKSISVGIKYVLNNHKEMSENAMRFFESVNNKQTIKDALEEVSFEIKDKIE